MKTVRIKRQECCAEGTFGVLTVDNGFTCLTGELPDHHNQANLSSIPKGTYRCRWGQSPRYGMCYRVEGVPGRTDVLIHPANLMGDVKQGFVTQLHGCIALGKSKEVFQPSAVPQLKMTRPQRGIAASKKTVEEFVTLMNREEFQLIIE